MFYLIFFQKEVYLLKKKNKVKCFKNLQIVILMFYESIEFRILSNFTAESLKFILNVIA